MTLSTPRNLDQASAGLGLRRALTGPLQDAAPGGFDFLEAAPENWIGVGGRYGRALAALSERYPLVCHGLSLSLGGPEPLDEAFLHKLRRFLDMHRVPFYSEHLSYCSDDGQLYDLMPIPFTDEAVHHVAARIRRRRTSSVVASRWRTSRTTPRRTGNCARSSSSTRSARGRLRPAARRQQHPRQQRQPSLRRARVPARAAGASGWRTSTSPDTTTKRPT
jgi:hypothetical protein